MFGFLNAFGGQKAESDATDATDTTDATEQLSDADRQEQMRTARAKRLVRLAESSPAPAAPSTSTPPLTSPPPPPSPLPKSTPPVKSPQSKAATPSVRKKQSIELSVNDIIERSLHVCVCQTQTSTSTSTSTTTIASSSHKHNFKQKACLYLSELAQQLEQQTTQRGPTPLVLTIGDVDQVICTRLQMGIVGNSTSQSSPLGWLLHSLVRVQQLRDGQYRIVGSESIDKTLGKIEEVLSNYLLTMLSIPNFAESQSPHEDTVAELAHRIVHMQGGSDSDRGTKLAIQHLCTKSEEGGFDALRSVLHHIVLGDQSLLHSQGSTTVQNNQASNNMMFGGFSQYNSLTSSNVVVPLRDTGFYFAVQNAVASLCFANKNAVGGVLMESLGWSNELPIATGAQMEHCTLLGVLLRVGVSCLPSIPPELFSPPESDQGMNGSNHQLMQQQRTNMQMQWAMRVSGTNPSYVSNDNDPPITRFQVRAQLLRFPQFQIGPSDLLIAARDFPWPNRTPMQAYTAAQQRIHGMLTPVWDSLHRIVHAALRNKTQRAGMVQWLSRAVALQAGRDKSHRDQFREASDSFALNLFCVLLRLCDPIMKLKMDGSWPMLGKIQSCIFFRKGKNGVRGGHASEALTSGVYLHDTPWLHEPQSNSDSNKDDDGSVTSATEIEAKATAVNFPTQCFFLTSRSLHLSCIKILSTQQNLQQMAQQFARENPAISQGVLSVWLTRQVQLRNPDLLGRLVKFCSFTSGWLLRAMGHTGMSWKETMVPGSISSAAALSHIPQHMVEDIVGILNMLSGDPHIVKSINTLVPGHTNLCGGIIRCLVALLSGGKHCIASPHVRAKIGDVIHQCFFPPAHQQDHYEVTPILPLSLFSDPFFVSVLLPSLLQLYGDVKSTGFYETVQHRGNLSIIIKHLLSDTNHRDALLARVSNEGAHEAETPDVASMEERKSDTTTAAASASPENEFNFLNTANGLMSQANSAITEGLSRLELVKKHQDLLKDIARWQAQTEEARNDAEEQYQKNEREVKHYLDTAVQALDLLVVITGHMQQLFMNQILLKSLSSTLTILLRKLIKSQTSLKVNNPEKYGFNAKELLRSVVTTCLHMVGGNSQGSDGVESRHSALFCAALATQYDGNDGGGIFDRATKIIRKHGILRPNDFQGKGIEMWLSLVTSVKADIQSLKADEKILGEVPDEFECPLLCTIMEDPVKLPSGKNIIFVLLLFSTIPPT